MRESTLCLAEKNWLHCTLKKGHVGDHIASGLMSSPILQWAQKSKSAEKFSIGDRVIAVEPNSTRLIRDYRGLVGTIVEVDFGTAYPYLLTFEKHPAARIWCTVKPLVKNKNLIEIDYEELDNGDIRIFEMFHI